MNLKMVILTQPSDKVFLLLSVVHLRSDIAIFVLHQKPPIHKT